MALSIQHQSTGVRREVNITRVPDVKAAIRAAFGLAEGTSFSLVDSDGCDVVLDTHLPAGQFVLVPVEEKKRSAFVPAAGIEREESANLVFAVNGKKYNIPAADVDPTMTLNEFLRTVAKLRGTKISCGEGGCGACAVALSRYDRATHTVIHSSCNSCLRLLSSMDGWAVTTTEGLGNSKKLHPVQTRIAGYHGTQCGYCTPGMVMTLYSMMKVSDGAGGKTLTMDQLESFFDGNICRCTGYRPILDAAKSFAKDSKVVDYINEEKMPVGPYDDSSDPQFPEFLKEHKYLPQRFLSRGVTYSRPTSLANLISELVTAGAAGRVVCANTSTGIYKNQRATTLIDVQHVPELNVIDVHERTGVSFGAAVNIGTTDRLLRRLAAQHAAKKTSMADHFIPIADHLQKIANHHVRNVGSLGGNLVMTKTEGFLSDLATVLLAASATVTVVGPGAGGALSRQTQTVEEFLSSPHLTAGQVLETITIPWATAGTTFRTYKTAIRPVNAHAYVNAAFNVTVNDGKISQAILAFGGVMEWDRPGSHPVRARESERLLVGAAPTKDLFKRVISTLSREIKVEGESAAYRLRLVTSFFFKFSLLLQSDDGIAKKDKSARDPLPHHVSSGRQEFVYDKKERAPIYHPIAKIEGRIQASGEAVYTSDLPLLEGTLHAWFVESTIPKGTVVAIDGAEALASPGVVALYTPKDIPGRNVASTLMGFLSNGPLLAVEVEYLQQPIALIVAETVAQAMAGAKLVKVRYEEKKDPVYTLAEAMKRSKPDAELKLIQGLKPALDFETKVQIACGDLKTGWEASAHKLSGRCDMGTQKHFYMETQVAYTIPDEEDRLIVHTPTQGPGEANTDLAHLLGISQARIKIVSKRAGGGFGGRFSLAALPAGATALAAMLLRRPVFMHYNRAIDMALCGGREEIIGDYTVGFDATGKITAFETTGHVGAGFNVDASAFAALIYIGRVQQSYELKNASLNARLYKTNICGRTSTRGPADPECGYVMETAIAHIAHQLGIPADVIRERNFYAEEDKVKPLPLGLPQPYYTINALWKRLKARIDYDKRRAAVTAFNAANRWKKRGLALVPVTYLVFLSPMNALVNIYKDGSILIAHSGCEMGQGLNTKAAQVAAMELGTVLGQPIPFERIKFQDLNSHSSPNGHGTGGSTGSESIVAAVRSACSVLVTRLKEVLTGIYEEAEAKKAAEEKEKKEGKAPSGPEGKASQALSWDALCAAADHKDVHLQSSVVWKAEQEMYNNYGVGASEVEVDILTGETKILMSTMVYDCGKSLNPAIDIGQLEGGFMMGVGLWLREKETYDHKSGKLLSEGTWMYKPPSARDVPLQFDVELLQNDKFEKGVLSSKASGESPLVLSASVIMGVREAITDARKEVGITEFFQIPVPATPEDIVTLCGHRDADLAAE